VSVVPGSTLVTKVVGFNGLVLIIAPEVFACEGKLSPIAFIDYTVATTKSASSKLKGALSNVVIGMRQK
jgi:hypothetical protein